MCRNWTAIRKCRWCASNSPENRINFAQTSRGVGMGMHTIGIAKSVDFPVTSRVRVSLMKKIKKKSRNDDNTDTAIHISAEYQSTE